MMKNNKKQKQNKVTMENKNMSQQGEKYYYHSIFTAVTGCCASFIVAMAILAL